MPITPTTWDPTVNVDTPYNEYTNGNLTVAQNGIAVSLFAASTGKYYFEMTFGAGEPLGELILGVVDTATTAITASLNGVDLAGGRRFTSEAIGWDGTSFTPVTLASGCTIGVYIDVDASTIGCITSAGDTGILMTGFTALTGDVRVAFAKDPWQYSSHITGTANFGGSSFTFTPPSGYSAGFGATGAGTSTASIVAPVGTVRCYLGGSAQVSGPAATALGYFGGHASIATPAMPLIDTITWLANITGVAPTVSSFGGGYAQLVAPSALAYSVAHDASGENAVEYTAPSPTLRAFFGGFARLTAPRQLVTMSGTFPGIGSAALTSPAATVDSTGTVSGVGRTSLTVPMARLIGYSGAVCSVTLDGGPTVAATGTTGSIGNVSLTLPLFVLTASGGQQNHGSVDILAPVARLGATSLAYIVAPGAQLSAVGHAVVAVTYEAYAVNLKHLPAPGREPVDETTRYTNFPFTHIVRYKNSYFGANSTGLYLLDGTTDAGTPIPWAFKTALMDFKSPFQKTVASAYFGGRLGAADTITLYPGEGAGTAYSYTTPRGALAQNHRQAFGKGIKQHRYYAIGANGTDVLELDTIGLDVHLMTRRI